MRPHPTPSHPHSSPLHFRQTPPHSNNLRHFLDSVKLSHQDPIISRGVQNEYIALDEAYKTNEAMLRERIRELQVENNNFRRMCPQFQYLLHRNQSLQEQILLLLSEIEQRQMNTPRTFEIKEKSTKERNFATSESNWDEEEANWQEAEETVESSEEIAELVEVQRERSSSKRSEGNTNPFMNINLRQQKRLGLSRRKIEKLVQEQIEESINSVEAKFMDYLERIEEQLAEMRKTNEEIADLKQSPSSCSEQSFVQIDIQSTEKERVASERDKVASEKGAKSSFFRHHNPQHLEMQSELLKHEAGVQSQKKREDRQISEINIELGSLTSSHPSFGRSQFLPSKPENDEYSQYDNIYDQSDVAFSVNPFQDKFTSIAMSRVFQEIGQMREHITFILNQKQKLTDSTIDDFQQKVHQQLKDLIQTFLTKSPFEQNQPQAQLTKEVRDMKAKMQEMHRSFLALEQALKCRPEKEGVRDEGGEARGSCEEIKAEKGSCEQFIKTERRLVRVIEVMKSFNSQYQQVLERSRAIEAGNRPQRELTLD